MYVAVRRTSGRDFRLDPQFVVVQDARFQQRLVVEQLGAGPPVMQFVAHDLAVGAVQRQIHPLDQQYENPVHRHVVRRFDRATAAAGNVKYTEF